LNVNHIQGIQNFPDDFAETDHSTDLVIGIKQNATGIRLHSNISFYVTLTKNGRNKMHDIDIGVSNTATNVDLTPTKDYYTSNLEKRIYIFL
jgi:hypothetical protein